MSLGQGLRPDEVRALSAAGASVLTALAVSLLVLSGADAAAWAPPRDAGGAAEEERRAHLAACRGDVDRLELEARLLRAESGRLDVRAPGGAGGEAMSRRTFPALSAARSLVACRAPAEALLGARRATAPAWDTVLRLANLSAAGARGAEPEAAARARELLLRLDLAPLAGELEGALRVASAQVGPRGRDVAAARSASAGRFRDELGVAGALLLASAALAACAWLARAEARRRRAALTPPGDPAGPSHEGEHAARVLLVAATPSRREALGVVAAALACAVAAVATRGDGVATFATTALGLLVGLGAERAARDALALRSFRERALELAARERPALPIALVLSAVPQGGERAWLDRLAALAPDEAAATVSRLSREAEARIVARATPASRRAP